MCAELNLSGMTLWIGWPKPGNATMPVPKKGLMAVALSRLKNCTMRFWAAAVGARRSCPSSRWRATRSGGAPFVSMMKASDLGDHHDVAVAGRRDRTRDWRVLVERQVH